MLIIKKTNLGFSTVLIQFNLSGNVILGGKRGVGF